VIDWIKISTGGRTGAQKGGKKRIKNGKRQVSLAATN